MKFYLSGQRTFGNRGCEAIVRSTVIAFRKAHGEAEFLVPSDNIELDSAQWPEAGEHGVKFVPAYMPKYARYWVHAQRLPLPMLKRAGWPFPLPQWLKDQIASVDAVLAIGGDNYSLDYRLPSLLMGIDSYAMDIGKPVILWGASVGPFEREPDFVPAIKRHLARMKKIMVRESVTFHYLTNTVGLINVEQMVDPAFTLKPEPMDIAGFWPDKSENGVIGLNVSPLIERYRAEGQSLVDEVEGFIYSSVDRGYSVLMIPHVTPLDGGEGNSDASYMTRILARCSNLGDRLTMAPRHLNAAQYKYLIGRVRFFVGARTHATIAALSSGVPTISIAYSVKARGINRDLFGDEWMVLPTPKVSQESLLAAIETLVENEAEVRETLSEKLPTYRSTVLTAANYFSQSAVD